MTLLLPHFQVGTAAVTELLWGIFLHYSFNKEKYSSCESIVLEWAPINSYWYVVGGLSHPQSAHQRAPPTVSITNMFVPPPDKLGSQRFTSEQRNASFSHVPPNAHDPGPTPCGPAVDAAQPELRQKNERLMDINIHTTPLPPEQNIHRHWNFSNHSRNCCYSVSLMEEGFFSASFSSSSHLRTERVSRQNAEG